MGLSGTASVFVSYSHEDRVWLDRLKTLLAPCFRDGRITWWDDTAIRPGDSWRDRIDQALETAKVAVLMVSRNFLASDFISREELPVVLRAAADNRVRLLWMLLNDCLYDGTGIAGYQALHDTKRPLDGLSKPRRDTALARIARGIVAELALVSVESGLSVVDATSSQLEAVTESSPVEKQVDFGIVAVRESDRIAFRSRAGYTYETITADDMRDLDVESLELIQTLEESMRRQFQEWRGLYPSRIRADGTLDASVDAELKQIAKPMCAELRQILDFLASMGKHLHDHYARYHFICDRLI